MFLALFESTHGRKDGEEEEGVNVMIKEEKANLYKPTLITAL
jgi:hypothetical protein